MRDDLYHYIDESTARTAYELGHYDQYAENSATESYRKSVDRIVSVANSQKALTKPCYHERIDRMTQQYSKKLADLINKSNRVDAYYPSSFVTGRAGRSRKKSSKQYDMYRSVSDGWEKLTDLERRIAGFSERKGVKLRNGIATIQTKGKYQEQSRLYSPALCQ